MKFLYVMSLIRRNSLMLIYLPLPVIVRIQIEIMRLDLYHRTFGFRQFVLIDDGKSTGRGFTLSQTYFTPF